MIHEVSAYDLWEGCFSIGDELVLITDEDKVLFGKLTHIEDDGLFLNDDWVPWEHTRFASHDGFPVRKVFHPGGWKSILKTRTKERAAQVRELLRTEFEGKKRVPSSPMPRFRVCFGDPFDIERASVRLFNEGNGGEYFNDEPDEEAMLLVSQDGARALLWDLASVLEVEAA